MAVHKIQRIQYSTYSTYIGTKAILLQAGIYAAGQQGANIVRTYIIREFYSVYPAKKEECRVVHY